MRDAAAPRRAPGSCSREVVDQIGLVVRRVHIRDWRRGNVCRKRSAKLPSRLERTPRCHGRSRPAGEARREAVDGHQDRSAACCGAPVEQVRRAPGGTAGGSRRSAAAAPARKARCWPGRACRRSTPGSSPAPRTAGCSRRPGGCSAAGPAARRAARDSRARQPFGADVEAMWRSMSAGADAEIAEPLGHGAPGMFAGQHEGRRPSALTVSTGGGSRSGERRRLGFAGLKHRWLRGRRRRHDRTRPAN